MSINWQILGSPGSDNALLVTVDSGHSQTRFLFDCGEGCLSTLRNSEIQAIDHLCFSHFHMDHVSGFDTFFRHNYNRPNSPVNVWGPPDALKVMSHRFRSFTWNLHAKQPGEWLVHEISESSLRGSQFFTREAFEVAHMISKRSTQEHLILSAPEIKLEAILLPHHSIFSCAYRLRESDRLSVSSEALEENELSPGPWLQALSETRPDSEKIEVDGKQHNLGELRKKLQVKKPGESIAYLTDFRIEPDTEDWTKATEWLQGTDTLVCECQYLAEDSELAQKHGHMTADVVGKLASDSKVSNLVLQHLSRRYRNEDWEAMKLEASKQFDQTRFPSTWGI